MDRKALGARIKAQRIKCGFSQEEFAEKLHCTSSHIGKVENGKVGVSIELLVSIANELQTTVDQLLQDSYDYKEQVIIRDIYKRIGNLPIKTKITACEMLQYLIDIIEKAHD